MKLRMFLAVCLLAFSLTTADAKSRDPIRFAEGQTIEQQIVNAIARRALAKAGFKSDVFPLERESLLQGLIDGTVHAHPAVLVAHHPSLGTAIEEKAVRSLGGLARNAADEDILKLVRPGMKRKWPDAQKLLKRMILSPAQLMAVKDKIDAGSTVEEAVQIWWRSNARVWKPWIAASKNWMKP